MTNYEIGLTIIVIVLAVVAFSNRYYIEKLCDVIDILTEGFHDTTEAANGAVAEAKDVRDVADRMLDANKDVLESLKAVLEDMKKVYYGNQG